MSLFKKYFTREKKKDLDKGLEKTKSSFFGQIAKAVAGKSKVDEAFLDELEGILISSDVGLDTTVKIIERLESCLLYTSPSPRDRQKSRMPSSA